MDQTALAERLNLPKSSISRIFGGSRELKVGLAREMARELGVTLDYLVDDSVEDPSSDQFVAVSEDELTVLKLVRRLGVEVALDRLLQVADPPAPPASEAADLEMYYLRGERDDRREPS
ncbi:MAG: hypothetical protein NVSMB14_03380 [Isosphaeraceae bacterium]